MSEEKYKDPNVYGEEARREGEPAPGRPVVERPVGAPYTGPTTMPMREYFGFDMVRWGPIWGGLFVALAAEAILMTLGIAIGLGAGTVAVTTPGAAANVAAGAGIWAIVAGIISFFLGGYFTARMMGYTDSFVGAMNGLVVFSFALMLGLLIAGLATVGLFASIVNFLGVPISTPAGPVIVLSAASALWFFFWMLLGAIAAALGGYLGVRKPIPTR